MTKRTGEYYSERPFFNGRMLMGCRLQGKRFRWKTNVWMKPFRLNHWNRIAFKNMKNKEIFLAIPGLLPEYV
jgi:hypothetical protein